MAPDSTPAAKTEAEFCRANGILFVSLPLENAEFTEAQAAQFLATVRDPACQPVLIHCEYGRNRTGYAVAYYRIAVDHWTYEAAVDEARRLGFPKSSVKGDKSLRALAAGAPAKGSPEAPAKTDK